MLLTYLCLILQFEVGAKVEAALALHGANNCLGSIWREVDSRHHFMHICPVHNPLVWNVPHSYLRSTEKCLIDLSQLKQRKRCRQPGRLTKLQTTLEKD